VSRDIGIMGACLCLQTPQLMHPTELVMVVLYKSTKKNVIFCDVMGLWFIYNLHLKHKLKFWAWSAVGKKSVGSRSSDPWKNLPACIPIQWTLALYLMLDVNVYSIITE